MKHIIVDVFQEMAHGKWILTTGAAPGRPIVKHNCL